MKTLLSADDLRTGVVSMADRINRSQAGKPLTVIGVLTGSLVLLADLIRLLDMPSRVGVVQASSYREGIKRGPLTINVELMPKIAARDVLLVDDIFDTGHTLKEVMGLMKRLQPASIRSCVLLRKVGCSQVDVEPDFAAFDIPDVFVVGYGLDYCDAYRNLPYLAALEPGEISRDPE
ncbi:MAG: phosphoribosyltransferase family protein [Planctomycetota bacterium]|nr:phosphoribosyltransferase family protein [Planctomycetota bacterium]